MQLEKYFSKKLIYIFFIVNIITSKTMIFSATNNKDILPNIIIIAVDTLRADHLSCYGYPVNTSPNVDALAKDGVLFPNCFTLTPLTAPAFSTMLTSLPPYKHGAKRNGLSVYDKVKTLPFYLKKLNYYSVAIISNWPLRKRLSRLNKYFNEYKEVFTKKRWLGIMQPEGRAEDVTKKATNWIDNNLDRRFFLWVHYTEPHAPYINHKNFDFTKLNYNKKVFPQGSKIRKIKKYDSEISYTDNQIGILLKYLEKKKIYESSLILFLADHGESFGEHNYYKHGRRLYNSTLNVPLIIKFPGNKHQNTKNNTPANLTDIVPTILSLINLKIPDYMEGIPLFLKNKKRDIFFETYRGAVHIKKSEVRQIKVKPTYFGLLQYPIKIIAKVNFRNLRYKKVEVYNIKNDSFEENNIWNYKSTELLKLSKKLKKHIYNIKNYIKYSKKHYKQKSEISKEDMEKLKSLGYIH